MSSNSGRIAVFKDGRKKYIFPEELQEYLNNGYIQHQKRKEKRDVELLAERVDKQSLYDYYEIQNHCVDECVAYFQIKNAALFFELLKFYHIKKSAKSRTEKIKQGKLLKYGDENYNNKEQTKKTCLEKYGVSAPVMTPSCRESAVSKQTRKKAQETYLKKTGKKVWNQGEKGLQKWKPGQAEKRHNTMVENNSFNSSAPEEELYIFLCQEYGKDNVKRNYNQDSRYPWHCDFYITTEDLFIELNKFPTHYFEPFDEHNIEHQKLLEHCKQNPDNWIEEQMVDIWAGTDVVKRKTAQKNNLNYITIY